jgi:uncharacterized membrane protein YphA (DoxX/SURF4 family)
MGLLPLIGILVVGFTAGDGQLGDATISMLLILGLMATPSAVVCFIIAMLADFAISRGWPQKISQHLAPRRIA